MLNILFSGILAYFLYVNLNNIGFHNLFIFLSLLAIIFIAPLPALIFTGMEHILHITISLVFVIFSARLLENDNIKFNSNMSIKLLLIAPLLSSIRYEGLFIIFGVCVLLFFRKRYLYCLSLGMISLVPIIIYGVISKYSGWYWLPNSLLLKGTVPSIETFSDVINLFRLIYDNIFGVTHFLNIKDFGEKQVLYILYLSSCLLFLFNSDNFKKLWSYHNVILMIFFLSTMLHSIFADFGWFYRYEAYLITLGIYVNIILIRNYFNNDQKELQIKINRLQISKIIVLLFLTILAYPVYIQIINGVTQPFAQRISTSLLNTSKANYERYQEHVLPAIFICDYTDIETIIINDIGAISYYNNDIKILDLYGLGSKEPLEYRKQGYSNNNVRKWAKENNADIAYIQIHWREISPLVPEEWTLIAIWEIPHNIVFGDTKFAWYVINKNIINEITYKLKAFSKNHLPSDMNYEFYN
jgi:hypothetical protein